MVEWKVVVGLVMNCLVLLSACVECMGDFGGACDKELTAGCFGALVVVVVVVIRDGRLGMLYIELRRCMAASHGIRAAGGCRQWSTKTGTIHVPDVN